MDPIQPIERRSPWISELAPTQARSVKRERRKASGGNGRKPGPRREPPREEHGPEDDGPEGRHIDVRA